MVQPYTGDSPYTRGFHCRTEGQKWWKGSWGGGAERGHKTINYAKKNNAKESRWGNSYYRSMLQGMSDEKKEKWDNDETEAQNKGESEEQRMETKAQNAGAGGVGIETERLRSETRGECRRGGDWKG